MTTPTTITPTTGGNIRQQILDEIDSIVALDDQERETISAVRDWIQSGAEIFRRVKPDVPPQHLVAYSVLIDGPRVLLVAHRNAGLWLPSGGHVDPDEHPQCAAIRELREELDLTLAVKHGRPLFITRTLTVGAGPSHYDVSLWYVFAWDQQQPLNFDGVEFTEIRWFHTNEIPLDQCDPEMGRFITKLASMNP